MKTKLRDDAAEVANGCGANLSRLAARQITRFLDVHLQTTGLTIEQFDLMSEIAAAVDDSIAALAKKTCMEISTVSRNLRFLESKGWVEIATRGTGSRRRLVWLTEAGALQLAAAVPLWRQANRKLLRKVELGHLRKVAADARKLK